MLKRVLLGIFLAGLFSAAWGQDFGLDVGCCSEPLTQAATVNGNGGGVTDYYNSTSSPITELEFALVGTGLTSTDTIDCKSFNFFQTCDATLSGGVLFLNFHGITGSDSDDGFGSTDPETQATEGIGVFEGIPTLRSQACLSSPDSAFCTVNDRGHFLVSFDNFTEGGGIDTNPGDGGAWNGATSASIVMINNVAVPEPSSLASLAIGLLLVGRFWRRASR
jgi:PEP-CTERM motif-containing protein